MEVLVYFIGAVAIVGVAALFAAIFGAWGD